MSGPEPRRALSGNSPASQKDTPTGTPTAPVLGQLGQLAQLQISPEVLEGLSNADRAALRQILTPRTTKYIPHVPTAKQAAFMLLDCKEAFYGGSAGGGKALALDTPILTRRGWKTMGTLELSDEVVAADGTWTELEYITEVQPQHECLEVSFNNGETIVADTEHLWVISEYYNRSCWVDSVVTTGELREKMKLPRVGRLCGRPSQLGIDPYVFGFWLGDGNARTGSVTIGNEDIDFMRTQLPTLRRYASQKLQYTVEGLTTRLRLLGVLRSKFDNRITAPETKHIPENFILSSHGQRLALLQGLMDSDGSVQERGRCEISLKEARLFTDVCTLLSSLGIVYSATRTARAYRATFTTTLPIFRLPRKLARLTKKPLSNRITVKSVRPAGRRDVRCIRVRHPSHTFLCGRRLVPTHNSDALLMCALQYVDVPGYSAILFRKSYADLTKPGALMDRAKEWLLPHKDVRWDEKDKRFVFYRPGTKMAMSTLQFGYLENPNDRFNYQGGEYQFIGFDELTHIAKVSYTYMFSRLRRLKGVDIPLRVRSASNPPEDDLGNWVRDRFIVEGPENGRIFIPAGLDDNPYLDKEEYEQTLEQLDPVSRARLRDGDWSIVRKGNMFRREMFELVDTLPANRRTVRWWDMAASDERKSARKNKSGDPDYTASVKVSESQGIYYVEDIIRVRMAPEDTERLQGSTAISDGHGVQICEEQEPGSSGIAVISSKSRGIFQGYSYKGVPSSGDKATRAQIASAAAGNGNIKIVRGVRNLEDFLTELESFPGGRHDDMVDCLAGAVAYLGLSANSAAPPIVVRESDEQVSTWIEESQDDYAAGLGPAGAYGTQAGSGHAGYFSSFGM